MLSAHGRNVKEEALLAVKWKEPAVLKQHLQDSADIVLSKRTGTARSARSSFMSKGDVDLLQVALTRPGGADISVVNTILSYMSTPEGSIKMDSLFHKNFDRYPVKESKGMWGGTRRRKSKKPSTRASLTPATAPTQLLSSSKRSSKHLASRAHLGGNAPKSGRPSSDDLLSPIAVDEKVEPEAMRSGTELWQRARTKSRTVLPLAMIRSGTRQRLLEEVDPWLAASDVLSAMIDGYAFHLDARRELGPLKANWTDLMMWAVLSGQHSLAEALWCET